MGGREKQPQEKALTSKDGNVGSRGGRRKGDRKAPQIGGTRYLIQKKKPLLARALHHYALRLWENGTGVIAPKRAGGRFGNASGRRGAWCPEEKRSGGRCSIGSGDQPSRKLTGDLKRSPIPKGEGDGGGPAQVDRWGGPRPLGKPTRGDSGTKRRYCPRGGHPRIFDRLDGAGENTAARPLHLVRISPAKRHRGAEENVGELACDQRRGTMGAAQLRAGAAETLLEGAAGHYESGGRPGGVFLVLVGWNKSGQRGARAGSSHGNRAKRLGGGGGRAELNRGTARPPAPDAREAERAQGKERAWPGFNRVIRCATLVSQGPFFQGGKIVGCTMNQIRDGLSACRPLNSKGRGAGLKVGLNPPAGLRIGRRHSGQDIF